MRAVRRGQRGGEHGRDAPRIGHYRREPISLRDDPAIGCLFIRDVRFFPAGSLADPPPGFTANIVQGKGFDLGDIAVSSYFEHLLQLLLGGVIELDFSQPWHRDGPVFGDPRLAPYRLGQQAFKAKVLDAYYRRCAITGSKIWPVLEAAHIRPVASGGEHRLDNGLLLRSEVHTLFDRGYLAVDPGYRLRVSPRLREDFDNGDRFYAQAGQVAALPERRRTGRSASSWSGTSTKCSKRPEPCGGSLGARLPVLRSLDECGPCLMAEDQLGSGRILGVAHRNSRGQVDNLDAVAVSAAVAALLPLCMGEVQLVHAAPPLVSLLRNY